MILHLYRTLTRVLSPIVQLYLDHRRAQGKESQDRFHERAGLASVERPKGPLVWFHAASVGEAVSLLPLIESLNEDWSQITLLLTTGTVTSAELMERRLPRTVIHQYVPVDLPKYVNRFIGHWAPDLAIWAESEIWPNLLQACRNHGCKMVLVNGRMSPRSFKRWSKLPASSHALFSSFDLVFGQTEEDAARLRALGAENTRCLGNLKYAAPPLPAESRDLERLQTAIAARPVWIAASTHPGEDASVARVHVALRREFPNLLTLIAPRHVICGDDVEASIRAEGLTPARRSRGELPNADTDVYICDTMGEMGVFYRVAPIVVMGKSWIGQGGQNPLEPARLGCAVLFGPHMNNFGIMASRMVEHGAARLFADEADLTTAIADLLQNDGKRRQIAQAGEAFASTEAASADRILEALQPYLTHLTAEKGCE